jgi:P4 family phage/plasmid primase-like protien
MYGSGKHNSKVYKLTHVYKYDLENDEKELGIPAKELVKKLSNRKFKDESKKKGSLLEEDEVIEKVNKILKEHNRGTKKNKVVVSKILEENDEDLVEDVNYENEKEQYDMTDIDIKIAQRLIRILSRKRAKEFETWIRVCWALKNVSNKLYESWIEFSKKFPKKFNEIDCKSVWEKARTGEGYGLSSIHIWAKEDNLIEYKKVIDRALSPVLDKAKSGIERDIAVLVYEMKKHEFKCTSLAHNEWFHFQGHRWVQVELGHTLNTILSTEIVTMIRSIIATMAGDKKDKTQEDCEKEAKIVKGLYGLIGKLGKPGYKNAVMAECGNLFYDNNFAELLDSKKHLIGFENGVYDLEEGIFRKGQPEDLLTFSTGYEYESNYTIDSPDVKWVEKFFSQVQPSKDMNMYVKILLCSYLDGHTKSETFIIWTGSGSNGKSKCIEYFQKAFGDYCGTLPVTTLTKKRNGADDATPGLAKMKGKRLGLFQEPESDDKINVGFMKELSGGDKIQTRKLYSDPIEFKPQFKLLLVCNRLPDIPSQDNGTWRRIRVTEWETEFVDVDKQGKYNGKALNRNQFAKDYNLLEKMEETKQAFMWLLLNVYYPIYKKDNRKITEPAKVTKKTIEYQKENDVFLEFFNCVLAKTDDIKTTELLTTVYATFKDWFKSSRSGVIQSKKTMEEYLKNRDFKYDKRFLYGYKIRDIEKENELVNLDLDIDLDEI